MSEVAKAEERLLRRLPSVDRLLQLPASLLLAQSYGHALTAEALRQALEQRRREIQAGTSALPMNATLVQQAGEWLQALTQPTLQPVINATGVIIHTNLGRAPLSQVALAAMQQVAAGYSNLEYDAGSGQRGSRFDHAAALLTRLTGAEGALVCNNNAAAVLLMLTALCRGREVIISRGQLVEIGGGFRVPDVMAQSGCRLVEVGTTNRTHLRDYQAAINENTAAILVAHHSNYKIVGFTAEPSLAQLAQLAHEHGLPLLYDQGSGALLDTAAFGLEHEPMVPEGVAAGADLVAFSGDKLLGGPQAGILVGREELVQTCRHHPLARAVRPDKLCLAALSASLVPYVTGQATRQIPVWQMIARPLAGLASQAEVWAAELCRHGFQAAAVDGHSTVGGGSLPGTTLPTRLVAIAGIRPDPFAARLRRQHPPVIARIGDDSLLLDPRTVLPEQEAGLLAALRGLPAA